jgi:putative membrane protein
VRNGNDGSYDAGEGGLMPDNETARTEPDYRFTLANERTFLAWIRTCLALLAAGVALDQFAPDLGSRAFRDVTGIVLALLAGGTAVGGLWRWWWMQEVIARGGRLRRGSLPAILAVGLTAVTIAVIGVLLRDLNS